MRARARVCVYALSRLNETDSTVNNFQKYEKKAHFYSTLC